MINKSPLILFCVLHIINCHTTEEDLRRIFKESGCIDESILKSEEVYREVFYINEGLLISANKTGNAVTNKVEDNSDVLSQINRIAQHNKIHLYYELLDTAGPANNQTFQVRLTLGSEIYDGEGSSLKKARRAAATLALANSSYNVPLKKASESSTNTPTVVLNNFALKLGFQVRYEVLDPKDITEPFSNTENKRQKTYLKNSNFSLANLRKKYFRIQSEEQQLTSPFYVAVYVGDHEYFGVGLTIQNARHDAAQNALNDMLGGRQDATGQNDIASIKSSWTFNPQMIKSPISAVHEFGQKEGLNVEFKIIDEYGPSHKKTFVNRCTIGDLVTEGEGKSKKESKRIAAEKMLELLKTEVVPLTTSNFETKRNKRKRKKTKIIKNIADKALVKMAEVKTAILQQISNFVSNENENVKKKKGNTHNTEDSSAKDDLLELTQSYGIHAKFQALKKLEDRFYTSLSLDVKPPHICIGNGITEMAAENNVALEGLKLLFKLGLLDGLNPKETEERFTFENKPNYVIAKDPEEKE